VTNGDHITRASQEGIARTTGAAGAAGAAGTVVGGVVVPGPLVTWAAGGGKGVGTGEVCVGGDDTGQGMLPSKCPHSPFPWTTIWKRSAKIAQFAPDTSNLGTEVGRTSLVLPVDIFAL
jgi:hypothetical protein